MDGRSGNGGKRDRVSSRVIEEENGLNQFQLEYQELPSYVEFFWTGGACAGGRKGARMPEEIECGRPGSFGMLGKESLCSARVFERVGDDGIEPGSVKRREKRAKMPTARSKGTNRRRAIRGIVRCAVY